MQINKMKVVILAGGFGTRISEETVVKPKPMVEIGGEPIIVHLMKNFYNQGYKDFIICAGYKAQYIKEYFLKFNILNSDFKIDEFNKINIINDNKYKWNVSIIDTGLESETWHRISKVKSLIGNEPFIMTYGDGLSDIEMSKVKDVFLKNNSLITISSFNKNNKFGNLKTNGDIVTEFIEKGNDDIWINAGFMIISNKIFDEQDDKNISFEFDVLPKLAKKGAVSTYKHHGFWKCMDTLKDKNEFEEMILNDECPWKK